MLSIFASTLSAVFLSICAHSSGIWYDSISFRSNSTTITITSTKFYISSPSIYANKACNLQHLIQSVTSLPLYISRSKKIQQSSATQLPNPGFFLVQHSPHLPRYPTKFSKHLLHNSPQNSIIANGVYVLYWQRGGEVISIHEFMNPWNPRIFDESIYRCMD